MTYLLGGALLRAVDDEDNLLEVFAVVVCLGEENLPTYDQQEFSGADPYANIVYDPGENCFRGESTVTEADTIDTVSAATLSKAIARAVAALDELLAQS